MLFAIQKCDGKLKLASIELRGKGPFACPECNREVVLKLGTTRINHFGHRTNDPCRYGSGETEAHRRCKTAIYKALRKEPGVTKLALERSLKTARPDISFYIDGVPVAIEVQISCLTVEKIIQRTEEYARKGIYVLWLLQWTPYVDSIRYSPRLWEKWIHTAYFGSVYYWIEGATIGRYHFEPYSNSILSPSWDSEFPRSITGLSKISKRYRTPIKKGILNLVKDFVPRNRGAWEGNGMIVPEAKLFMHRN